VVIDASVGIPIVRHEATTATVSRLLHEPPYDGARFLVPSLFWLEVLNVLVRRYRLTPAAVLEALVELDAAEIETLEIDRPMLLLAMDAVIRHGLTAYDAAYLALAEAADAKLLTADVRLASAAGARAHLIGPGTSMAEPRATYEMADWASWPGAAAYLKTLRTRASSGR